MKNSVYFFALLLFSIEVFSQSSTIRFNYDEAGNQILRYCDFLCVDSIEHNNIAQLITDTFSVNEKIVSSVNISEPINIHYSAEEIIELKNGFYAIKENDFSAQIEECID